jgi:hypothetical protein
MLKSPFLHGMSDADFLIPKQGSEKGRNHQWTAL